MTAEGTDLTRPQQELVALDASVSAARALTDTELLAAVASAHAVTVETAGEWARRVRRLPGWEQPAASTRRHWTRRLPWSVLRSC